MTLFRADQPEHQRLGILLLGGRPHDWDSCLKAIHRAGIKTEPQYAGGAQALRSMAGALPCQMILASPDFSGWTPRSILGMVREADSQLPWVLVSGTVSPEEAEEYFKAGAWDWISTRELWRLTAPARRALENHAFRQSLAGVETLWAGVGHDVNNLLSGVIGNSEYLLKFLAADAKARQALEGILTAGELSAAWVQQCVSAGRISPSADLSQVLERMESTLRLLAGGKIQLRLKTGRKPVPVAADPAQVARVVLNLVFNARDAMPEGGCLRVQAEIAHFHGVSQAPGARPAWGRISVADTGAGMDKETCRRIFDPLFTSKSQHLGLGLPTARALVEQNGGFIELKSGLRSGTTFYVYLPLAESVPQQETAGAARVEPGAKTILVVEDDPLLRGILILALKSGGYLVLEAGRAEEALEISRQHSIDLLLTDVRMPVMSGPELVSAVRAHEPGMRVVYISGCPDARLDGHGNGTAFLLKPFKPLALLQKIEETLR
ncbi:MAG: response regulator [Terriglobia bacterium]